MRACIRNLNEYLKGWIGFFWIVTDAEERTLHGFEAHIRRRLRAIKLRHWRRKRTIHRHLVKAGVKRGTAARYVYDGKRSWWALSTDFALTPNFKSRHKGCSTKWTLGKKFNLS